MPMVSAMGKDAPVTLGPSPSLPNAEGSDRRDVDAFLRTLIDERMRLRRRVADLEAVVAMNHQHTDSTIQGLQSWLTSTISVLQQWQATLQQVASGEPVQEAPTPPADGWVGDWAGKDTPEPVAATAFARNEVRPTHWRRSRLAYVQMGVLVATVALPFVMYPRMPGWHVLAGPQAAVSDLGVGTNAPTAASPQAAGVLLAGSVAALETQAASSLARAIGIQRPTGGLMISLNAHDDCWIRATVDGKRPLERLLQRGEEITLNAQEAVVLRLGNAGAVSLTINGRRATPLGRSGKAVNAQITQNNYMRFLEPS